MKYLKQFNESTEKLYWEIPDDVEDKTVDLNPNYAKSIMDNLDNSWTARLVPAISEICKSGGRWLNLTTKENYPNKSCAIHQTEDDYFICEYDYEVRKGMRFEMVGKIYQCDTFEGLEQFLKSEDIII